MTKNCVKYVFDNGEVLEEQLLPEYLPFDKYLAKILFYEKYPDRKDMYFAVIIQEVEPEHHTKVSILKPIPSLDGSLLHFALFEEFII